jgi:outer membrane protein assembly factor BamB
MLAIRLLVVTCILGLASQAVATDLPLASDLARHGLKMAWWGRAAIDPGREQVDFVVNDEEMVFVRSTTGIITAFDAETGRKMWSALIGRPDQQGFAPVSNANQLLVAVGMRLIAVNKKNGDILWELRLPKHPSTSPAVDDDQIYIGMVDGRVYAFDLRVTQQLHEQRRLPEFSHLAEIWRYQTPSEIVSPPISTARSVCFASSSGSFYSVSAKGQKLIFQFESDARILTPLGRNEKSILLAAENSQMYCLDQDNGQYRWTFTSAHSIRQQPRIFGSRCYVTPETVGTYALSMDSGTQLWNQPQEQARKILMLSQTRMYAFNAQKEIVIVDLADGKLVGKLPYRQYGMTPTNDRTDRMFLTTQDGMIVCLKERDSAIPSYHLHPEKRPILPEITPEEGMEAPAEGAMPAEPAAPEADGAAVPAPEM